MNMHVASCLLNNIIVLCRHYSLMFLIGFQGYHKIVSFFTGWAMRTLQNYNYSDRHGGMNIFGQRIHGSQFQYKKLGGNVQ